MQNKFHRRSLLRSSGIAVALPLLERMRPVTAREPNGTSPTAPRRRLVAINLGLGLHAPNIVPGQAGKDYEATPYLRVLEKHREQFTFFSGVSHPEVGGGHFSGKSFLTAAKHPNSAGFQNSISLDQLAAEQLGVETRFASLSLSSSGPGLSWSRAGVEVPTETSPSKLFQRLFLEGKPSEKAAQLQRLKDGRSVLDAVLSEAASMRTRLSGRDRQKMEQYFGAVRDAEVRLTKAQAWEDRPKPAVDVEPPRDQPDRTRMIERARLMYDMMHLAIETDSTRFITFYETGMNAVPSIPGVDTDYHMLSHHGKDPSKISQLTIVETEIMKALEEFLTKLADSDEAGQSLLDQTMVLFGSNLGNASSHDSRNMPIVLAGGGFKHGQHLAFDQENNYPLPKLYVSILQRLGLEIDTFADCTGTMDGLEISG